MSKSLGSVSTTISKASLVQTKLNVLQTTNIDTLQTSNVEIINFPRKTLFYLNITMSFFHFGLMAITLAIGNIELSISIYSTNLTFSRTNSTLTNMPAFDLIPYYNELDATLPLTWLVACFFLTSALAHIGNATLWKTYYERNLERCRVPTRFIEYFISAGIMILILAYNSGVREYMLLFAVTMLVATTMPYGYLTELIAIPQSSSTWSRPLNDRLMPYFLGHFPQLSAWIIILVGFYDQQYDTDTGPPWFVYLIIWAELGFFFSFGAVQLLQQIRPPALYYKGEIIYQFLSLISKGILGSILISNVLILSKFDELYETD
jgi:hypothetical protein